MNSNSCNVVGNGSNTASHVFTVHFDFAGVAVPHHAACGNRDIGPRSHAQKGFAGNGGGGEIVRKKLNGNGHGGRGGSMAEHKSKDSVNLTWIFENHLYSKG